MLLATYTASEKDVNHVSNTPGIFVGAAVRLANWIPGVQSTLEAYLLVRLLDRLLGRLFALEIVFTPRKLMVQAVHATIARVVFAPRFRVFWTFETEDADNLVHVPLGNWAGGSGSNSWRFHTQYSPPRPCLFSGAPGS